MTQVRRSILILGGAGMVGSHLADHHLALGSRVTVVDNLESGTLDNLDSANERLTFAHLDVGSQENTQPDSQLDRHIAASDFVYHLASPIGVGRAHSQGFETTRRIMQDGLNVVDACLRHRKPVLYTSSSEIYGRGGSEILSETDTAGFGLEPRWGYGAGKMAVEHLIAGIYRDHGIPAWIVRFFNVVGPRQNPKTGLVVSAFCAAALDDGDLLVHGDGSDRRTFLHVQDAVEAVAKIADTPDLCGNAVNVGGNENISILELAELVRELCGSGQIIFKPHDEVYGEDFIRVPDRRPDLRRLQAATGWQPKRQLSGAIEACVQTLRSRS